MTDEQKLNMVDEKVAFLESLFGNKNDDADIGIGNNMQDMMKECQSLPPGMTGIGENGLI